MKRTILALALGLSINAYATAPNPVPEQTQTQGQAQGQVTTQSQQATAVGGQGGSSNFNASLSNSSGDQVLSSYAPVTVNTSTVNDVKNTIANTNTITSGSTSTSSNENNSNASNSTSNAGNNTGTANVVVQGDQAQERNPVSTALAPIVYTGNDQCLVSVAGGAQGVGFGISFGMTARDEICEALKLTRQLQAMGYPEQALKLLKAADPRVAEAFK